MYDQELVELVLGHVRRRLSLDPVPLDGPAPPGELQAALSGLIRPEGNDPAAVMSLYENRLSRAVVSRDSPRFLSFVPGAPSRAAALFDMAVSAAAMGGISWAESAGAIAAENQVLGWLAGLAGMPESAGGCFVTGGTAGNLSALAVARDTAVRPRQAPVGSAGGPSAVDGRHANGQRAGARCADWQRVEIPAGLPPRVAVGDQTHSSVLSALRLLGLEPLLVPAPDQRLTGAALRSALERERAAPGQALARVIAVVASAGTTNAGIVDDLAGVAAFAREHGLWFHVDAAYGGAALLAPSARHRFAGIEHADSLVIDPHKWLLAPLDCGALLYRRPEQARAVHAQQADYYDTADRPEWNPADHAHHLSRRARGLPLWFSLAVHGTRAYTDAVEATLRLTSDTAESIRRRPGLKLLREPELSVLLFRRSGWTAGDYWAWSERLLADGVAFVTPTRWEGETVARLVLVHPGTTASVVAEVLDSMDSPVRSQDTRTGVPPSHQGMPRVQLSDEDDCGAPPENRIAAPCCRWSMSARTQPGRPGRVLSRESGRGMS